MRNETALILWRQQGRGKAVGGLGGGNWGRWSRPPGHSYAYVSRSAVEFYAPQTRKNLKNFARKELGKNLLVLTRQ